MMAASVQTLLSVFMIYLISTLVDQMNAIEEGSGDSYLFVQVMVLALVWFNETLPNIISYYYLNDLSETYSKSYSI